MITQTKPEQTVPDDKNSLVELGEVSKDTRGGLGWFSFDGGGGYYA